MAEIFRAEVLTDLGNPKLRHACLQLITKLRLENCMLNETKDGPEEYNRNNLKPDNKVVVVKELTEKHSCSEKEFKEML
jgi:hypothetical protein